MMRMSTKGHHATRIMIFLANSPGRPVSKAEISEGENISPGYLQQVMTTLTHAGLVTSYRGKAGGFALAQPAEEVTMQQVLQATEGRFELSPCLALECPRAEECAAHLLWLQAASRVNDLFDNTTIADLARTARSLHESPKEAA
jgi:Rrf2 family iron-sulfur cluster assembly transcriptional regulator